MYHQVIFITDSTPIRVMDTPDGIPQPKATSLDNFFTGKPTSRQIFEALVDQIASIGIAVNRVSKSQITFRRAGLPCTISYLC